MVTAVLAGRRPEHPFWRDALELATTAASLAVAHAGTCVVDPFEVNQHLGRQGWRDKFIFGYHDQIEWARQARQGRTARQMPSRVITD